MSTEGARGGGEWPEADRVVSPDCSGLLPWKSRKEPGLRPFRMLLVHSLLKSLKRFQQGVDGMMTKRLVLFPAARRILLPGICDSAILLSDALRHCASTRWCIVRPTLYTLTEAKIITLFG
jgi:hypothetical protein